MARTYAKVFFDWRKQMAALSDSERGRLYDAILEYGETGVVPELGGRESILFPVFQAQLDRDAISYQNKVNGASKSREIRRNQSDIRTNQIDAPRNQEQEEEKEEEKETRYKIQEEDKEDVAFSPSFQLADGSFFFLGGKMIQQLTDDFPMLDVWQTLADIKRWCAANPNKRKTRAGAERFVNAWFVRERDKKDKWKAEAEARKQPEKKRSGKYDEIYYKY